MTSDNHVKWDTANKNFTAYCEDDTDDTEIGPVKWDDGNNKAELNCESTDVQTKWDGGTKKFEAQGVSDDCCISITPCGCVGSDPSSIKVTFSGITDCSSPNCKCSSLLNDTFTIYRYTNYTLGCRYILFEFLYDDEDVYLGRVDLAIDLRDTCILVHAGAGLQFQTCFIEEENTNTCADVPVTINNSRTISDCSVDNKNGYGGTCLIERTDGL